MSINKYDVVGTVVECITNDLGCIPFGSLGVIYNTCFRGLTVDVVWIGTGMKSYIDKQHLMENTKILEKPFTKEAEVKTDVVSNVKNALITAKSGVESREVNLQYETIEDLEKILKLVGFSDTEENIKFTLPCGDLGELSVELKEKQLINVIKTANLGGDNEND